MSSVSNSSSDPNLSNVDNNRPTSPVQHPSDVQDASQVSEAGLSVLSGSESGTSSGLMPRIEGMASMDPAEAALAALNLSRFSSDPEVKDQMADIAFQMMQLKDGLSGLAGDASAMAGLSTTSQVGASSEDISSGAVHTVDNSDLMHECSVCVDAAKEICGGTIAAIKDVTTALNHRCRNKMDASSRQAVRDHMETLGLDRLGIHVVDGRYELDKSSTIFASWEHVQEHLDNLHHIMKNSQDMSVVEDPEGNKRSCCAYLLSGIRTVLAYIKAGFEYFLGKVRDLIFWILHKLGYEPHERLVPMFDPDLLRGSHLNASDDSLSTEEDIKKNND